MNRRVVNVKSMDYYDVYIGRPSPWGNPFRIGKDGTREEIIQKFKEFYEGCTDFRQQVKAELKNKILGCYCAPLPCHGDILAEWSK